MLYIWLTVKAILRARNGWCRSAGRVGRNDDEDVALTFSPFLLLKAGGRFARFVLLGPLSSLFPFVSGYSLHPPPPLLVPLLLKIHTMEYWCCRAKLVESEDKNIPDLKLVSGKKITHPRDTYLLSMYDPEKANTWGWMVLDGKKPGLGEEFWTVHVKNDGELKALTNKEGHVVAVNWIFARFFTEEQYAGMFFPPSSFSFSFLYSSFFLLLTSMTLGEKQNPNRFKCLHQNLPRFQPQLQRLTRCWIHLYRFNHKAT